MTAIIEVEGLTKSYGSKRGITNVSFRVEEGEGFGFLGPNGAGKPTTIRLLRPRCRPTRGPALAPGRAAWRHPGATGRLRRNGPAAQPVAAGSTGGRQLE